MLDNLNEDIKIFDREDLTYENDEFCDNFEEYMNIMQQEKAIEVFISTKDMIKYCKLEQENTLLHSIIKEVREILKKYISNPSGTKGGWHIDCWNNEDINRLNELLEVLDKENNYENI